MKVDVEICTRKVLKVLNYITIGIRGNLKFLINGFYAFLGYTGILGTIWNYENGGHTFG